MKASWWADFGRDVRLIRTARKLTQAQLAVAVGVDHTYISKIERGHVQPPAPQTIKKIGAACGVDPDWILHHFRNVSPSEMTRPQLEAQVVVLENAAIRAETKAGILEDTVEDYKARYGPLPRDTHPQLSGGERAA